MKEEKKGGARWLGDLIAEFMKTARPQRKELAELDEAWIRAAGADVARRSRPLSLKNGELIVSFESSVLRHEIESFRKAEILTRLKSEYPERRIAALRCVLR